MTANWDHCPPERVRARRVQQFRKSARENTTVLRGDLAEEVPDTKEPVQGKIMPPAVLLPIHP